VILATLCFFAFYSLPALNPTSPAGGWFAQLFPNPPRAYEAITHEAAAMGEHAAAHIHHVAHNAAMGISILVAGLGILIATLAYYWKRISPALWQRRLGIAYRGMFRKWWIDEAYDATVVSGSLLLSRVFAWFDLVVIDGIVNGTAWVTRSYAFLEGWFDLYAVDGLVNLTASVVGIWGKFVRVFQGGQVQRYIFYTLIVVGLLVLLSVFQGVS